MGAASVSPVPLVHRDSERVEESLKLDVEKSSASDEEIEPAAKVPADLAEEKKVVERILQPLPPGSALPACPSVPVEGVGDLESLPEQPLRGGALFADALFNVLPKLLAREGTLRRIVGRTSRMLAGCSSASPSVSSRSGRRRYSHPGASAGTSPCERTNDPRAGLAASSTTAGTAVWHRPARHSPCSCGGSELSLSDPPSCPRCSRYWPGRHPRSISSAG